LSGIFSVRRFRNIGRKLMGKFKGLEIKPDRQFESPSVRHQVLFSAQFLGAAWAAGMFGGVPRAFAPGRIASWTGRTVSLRDILRGAALFSTTPFRSPVWLAGWRFNWSNLSGLGRRE